MKTAMELALDRIELTKDINPDSIHWEMFKNNYLGKEKEQILAAYNNGSQDMALRDEYNPQEYYNQTYNQNNICQYCNKAKLVIVEADEPFSNKHLACPSCDSTFTYNQNK